MAVAADIAQASFSRIVRSGVVLFLLQCAISIVLMLMAIPVFWVVGLGGTHVGLSIDAIAAMLVALSLFVSAAATMLALAFVVGKRWAGARLLFIYDED